MERWSNDVVDKKILKDNMQMFLLWSMRENKKPTVSMYDKWLRKNNLRGKSGVIYKQFNSFAKLRDEIAEKIGYDFLTIRDYTTEYLIKSLNDCLKINGDLKYLTYRNWAKENNRPSPHPIIKRLELNWQKIRVKFGKLNKSVSWNKEKCRKKIFEYPEIKNMVIKEYEDFKFNKDLPGTTTIDKYFGSWLGMKKDVFDWESKTARLSIDKFCKNCLYYGDCDYNYNLDKCEWYEGRLK